MSLHKPIIESLSFLLPFCLLAIPQADTQSLTHFVLVQSFMTDRKAKEKDENKLALDIMSRAWEKKPLRDELYVQLCRQTTANNKT